VTAELLRDLIVIPERVHAGDFVLTLSKGLEQKTTITDYVVTPQLAECFDEALGVIKTAVETASSRAAYLDGSFGSGKSHFMAVLHAVLHGNPDARGKKGLADVVAAHDSWLRDRKFLLVPYHMIEAASLESAILGGYVAHVRAHHPGAPLPDVFVDDQLLADARDLRAELGDAAFIGGLPAGDEEWGEAAWDAASLDEAFAAPPQDKERRRLVGDLLAGPFRRYARAVRAEAESYISLDEGLSVISQHAKDVLGYDAVVLLLDELVLWLAGYIGDQTRVSREAQKVSKLVESAEHERPAPIISFVPRQRDLRDLVGRDVAGAVATSLFDTLKYWDGRFDVIKLDDRNLPAIVHERLLRPRDNAARAALDAAFSQIAGARGEVWDMLRDAQGGAADRAAFRATYPFSPAFLHAMVDISGALQRQRTALKLMQQLLVDYRDILPVGQLMPLGAIFDVLTSGADRPFTDKLRDEFEQAKRFYQTRVRPYLLARHRLTEEQAAGLGPRHALRADDLVVKTLLLAALVPNVPALRVLTASRLAALNHGSIVTMLPGRERTVVAGTLRDLSKEFGEIRVSAAEDPGVEIALIGVDTSAILAQARHEDNEASRHRMVRDLLWAELGITDRGEMITAHEVVWRGTHRRVEIVFANVRDRERLSTQEFSPASPDSLRVIIDYPFDEGNRSPAEDTSRVRDLQDQLDRPSALVWLPNFLSAQRLADLGDLIVICYVLERDRLDDLTRDLTADDRHHARTHLQSRRAALTATLRDALKRAYGVASPDDADLGARVEDHVLALDSTLELRPQVGQGLADALQRLCFQLLDHRYPQHPDFDPHARRQPVKRTELVTVLGAVERAVQDRVGRYEPPRTDIAVLKRIANPLNIGVMHEAAFVLRDDWKQIIDRRAAGQPEVRAGTVRGWITEEQPGLPVQIQDLVVACYAIQADRAWTRGGQQITPPELGKITPDMTLRSQELPTEEEFERASARAAGLFGVARQPVRSARAVHAIAGEVRRRAGDLLPGAETLVEKLTRHGGTLGLDDESPRLGTARACAHLLNLLIGSGDSTALLRALAGAELSREGAIYRASLDGARKLADALGGVRWQILDQLPGLAGEARTETAEASRTILDELRSAARRDQHEVGLAGPLAHAEQAAIDLIITRRRRDQRPDEAPDETPDGSGDQITGKDRVTRRLVPAREVPGVVEELCNAADANEDAEFEITWRIVTAADADSPDR